MSLEGRVVRAVGFGQRIAVKVFSWYSGKEIARMVYSIAWWPTAAAVAVATFTDLRSRRIPNWLVVPFFGAGVLVSCWFRGWHGLGQSLCGAGLGLLSFGVLFMLGGMGAGDVKLFAAIGAWIGPTQLLIALVLTALVGGAMALGAVAWGGYLGKIVRRTGGLVLGPTQESGEAVLDPPRPRDIPYGPAIAIGTLMSFLGH
jgi:prepilin peptidase CpaA